MLTKPSAKEFTEEMKKQKQDAGGQAGAEIEVTPEMIEAGVGVILDYYSEELQDEAPCVVRNVYQAMFSVFSGQPDDRVG